MITLLVGENGFETNRALKSIISKHDGEAERFDGAELNGESLASILSGQTLFSESRLCIIKDLSSNTSLWQELPTLGARLADSTHAIIVEPKPDKRTATFKWLKKHAEVHEFQPWTQRDVGRAEEWVYSEAQRIGTAVTHSQARLLIQRIGLDQWQLHHALQKVALLKAVTDEEIVSITDSRSEEDVFQLLDTALRGDDVRLVEMLSGLERTEDAYRVFGLLSSQIIQLAALTFGRDRNVAGDMGASPYALNRLAPHAARLSQSDIRHIMKTAAATDKRLKSTPADPWHLITHLVLEIART
jgi:DNA polymerase III delta subunit